MPGKRVQFDDETWMAELLIIFAGVCAQVKLTGNPHTPIAGDDKKNADNFFLYSDLPEKKRKHLTRFARGAAKELVTKYWGDGHRALSHQLRWIDRTLPDSSPLSVVAGLQSRRD